MTGSVFPEKEDQVLEISGKTLLRLFSESKQLPLQKSPLTITSLFNQLQRIASIAGRGSRSKKEAALSTLISQASETDAEYIIRIILTELRIGLAEGLILEATSLAANVKLELVKRSYALTGDLGETATKALTEHEEGLNKIELKLFDPIKPMLPDTASDFASIFSLHHGTTALDYKLDGTRVQIHKQGQDV
ncbi:MAG: hypothetical protein NTX81_06170 [Candidatus Bathyarchaeota archaeon]|jgi:DNA ligase-1|nr:hypothetical protein [Candidatus Bathyarchaeota archaeon]